MPSPVKEVLAGTRKWAVERADCTAVALPNGAILPNGAERRDESAQRIKLKREDN